MERMMHPLDKKEDRRIAYFSMEIGLQANIPTYSGGLGVLAGDTLKSAADLKVPVVAMTLLFHSGYFYQRLDQQGNQIESPVKWQPDDFMTLLPNKVSVTIEGREVKIQVWELSLKGKTGYELPVYFLDTDIEENEEQDRGITGELYGGDRRYRFIQEMVLGIGGIRMLHDLGYMNIEKHHMNEGHSALLILELLKENDYDVEKVREQCVFTTHTPVAAGHDSFDQGLVRNALGDMWSDQACGSSCDNNEFQMTRLALNNSKYVNGVAKKHGEVSRSMFPGYHIDFITNGVHSDTWTAEPFKKLYDTHIPGWRNDPFILRDVMGMQKSEIWDAHFKCKKKLIDYVNKEVNAGFDYDFFTIGFARRVTAYKRADLLFSDINRLVEMTKKVGKIQIIFGGKAHPNDGTGKDTIKRIFSLKDQIREDVKIIYLPNYNMEMGKMLVSGVDIWLNTPLRPMEASGTSGMKAAHNGVPHFSVLDGWWIEGHIENITGWSIGPKPKKDEHESMSDSGRDAEDLYNKLENIILPLYYNDRDEWIRKMRSAIALNASFFNTHRMMMQYVMNAYFN